MGVNVAIEFLSFQKAGVNTPEATESFFKSLISSSRERVDARRRYEKDMASKSKITPEEIQPQ